MAQQNFENAEGSLERLLDPLAPLSPLSEHDLGEMFRIMGQRWTTLIGTELRAAQARVRDDLLAQQTAADIQATIARLTKVSRPLSPLPSEPIVI